MNIKKYILASIVVYFIFELFTGLAKWLIFEDNFVLTMTIGDLLWAFIFVFIFVKMGNQEGLQAGFRFGLLIGLFCSSTLVFGSSIFEFVPDKLIDEGQINMFSAVPLHKAVPWFVLYVVKSAICGIFAGVLS